MSLSAKLITLMLNSSEYKRSSTLIVGKRKAHSGCHTWVKQKKISMHKHQHDQAEFKSNISLIAFSIWWIIYMLYKVHFNNQLMSFFKITGHFLSIWKPNHIYINIIHIWVFELNIFRLMRLKNLTEDILIVLNSKLISVALSCPFDCNLDLIYQQIFKNSERLKP